jgi:hypothetical protein
MRLRLSIPSERLTEGAIASRSINLRIKEGTSRIAVGVRDEVSGIQSSTAMTLPANLTAQDSGRPFQAQEAAATAS